MLIHWHLAYLTVVRAKRLGLTIAKLFLPQSEPRRLPAYRECLTHSGPHLIHGPHVIDAADIPNLMIASLVSVRFDLTYNSTLGLVLNITDIFVIKF